MTETTNELLVSAVSPLEIGIKAKSGRLQVALDSDQDLLSVIADQGFLPLAVTLEHAHRAGKLGGSHRDPFDLLLIAQALLEEIPVLSVDQAFDEYGVTRLW